MLELILHLLTGILLMVAGELKKNSGFGGQREQRNKFGAHGGTKNYDSSVNGECNGSRFSRRCLDFKIYIQFAI